MYACMYACLYACMHARVCMYVCMVPQSGGSEFDSRWVHDDLSVPLWDCMRFPVPEHQNSAVQIEHIRVLEMTPVHSRLVVSCPVQPRTCHWDCVISHNSFGLKRTGCTTDNWRCCLSLEVVRSIPTGSKIIHQWVYMRSMCQSIKIKPTNIRTRVCV